MFQWHTQKLKITCLKEKKTVAVVVVAVELPAFLIPIITKISVNMSVGISNLEIEKNI